MPTSERIIRRASTLDLFFSLDIFALNSMGWSGARGKLAQARMAVAAFCRRRKRANGKDQGKLWHRLGRFVACRESAVRESRFML